MDEIRIKKSKGRGMKKMTKFKKIETPIKDLYVIEPKVFGDNRGFFMESWNKRDFEEVIGVFLCPTRQNLFQRVLLLVYFLLDILC